MAPPTPKHPKLHRYQQPKPTTIDLIGGIYCSICKSTFRNKRDYDEHYIKHDLDNWDMSYTCVVCHKEILGYASFRGHCYTAHIIKTRFKCKICCKNFSKQTALVEHEESMHNFKCPQPCGKEFLSKQELQLHQIIHKDNGPPYPCQKCNDKLNSLDTCEKHMELHATFKYPCPLCSETFAEKSSVGQHLTQHFAGETSEPGIESQDYDCATNQLGIHCWLCDETFKSKTDIDSHFISEHNGKEVEYACTICGVIYEKYLGFANHCYDHIMKEKFKCEKCSRGFPRLSLLVCHAGICGRGDAWKCAHCDARFADDFRLRTHIRQAHAIDMLLCTEDGCDKMFPTMRELVRHQIIHTNNGNFCQHCGLEFTSLSSCEKHLDVHKVPSYTCPVCDKKFTDKYSASKHVSQHFQSVFHVCKICGKIYNAKFRLAEHMKSHSESKNYECDYCGKGFASPENLKQHVNTHTGDKPYQCVGCDKAFTSYPNLNKHLRRIHNIDPKTVKKIPQVAVKKDAEKPEVSPKITESDITDSSSNITESSSNVTESLTDLESSPNVLEESYMHVVESIGSENSIELENVDPCVLENVAGDMFGVNVEGMVQNNATAFQVPFDNLQQNITLQPAVSDWSNQVQPVASAANFPYEYGPDFINYQGLDTSTHNNGAVIELDDHILPHIDPLLTIKEQNLQNACDELSNVTYEHFDQNIIAEPQYDVKWEPPIITKLYQNYSYSEMPNVSSNILSVLQTDIY